MTDFELRRLSTHLRIRGQSIIVDVLGIAEGIETASAGSELFGVPCWSAICASNLLKFNPPFGLRRLIIFGDNDASFVGQVTAYELAHRLRRERPDLEIVVRVPEVAGQDWNDVLVFRGLAIAA
jgi:putative DNA primase/helicase